MNQHFPLSITQRIRLGADYEIVIASVMSTVPTLEACVQTNMVQTCSVERAI